MIAWYVFVYLVMLCVCESDIVIRRFERIVQDAYLWLSENYREGDKIFMFGKYGLHFVWYSSD